MIIDKDYFRGSIFIPHAKPGINSDVTSVSIELAEKIDEYSREVLIKCLGLKLFLELESQIDEDQDNKLKATADAKWDLLMNGEEYTDSQGYQRVWKGLRHKISEGKFRSFIADYVYYRYEYDDYIDRTGTGHEMKTGKNSEVVSPTYKVVNAWNNFVKEVQGEELNRKVYVSRHGAGVDYYSDDDYASLYTYITDKNNDVENTFADFKPKVWNKINRFGI